MDGTIRSIPSVRGPLSIGHNQKDHRRHGGGFEDALAEQPDERPPEDTEPDEPQKPLKSRLPAGRKDDQGRGHVDVLA